MALEEYTNFKKSVQRRTVIFTLKSVYLIMAAPTSPLVGPYNIIGRYAYERPQAEVSGCLTCNAHQKDTFNGASLVHMVHDSMLHLLTVLINYTEIGVVQEAST